MFLNFKTTMSNERIGLNPIWAHFLFVDATKGCVQVYIKPHCGQQLLQ